VTRVALAALLSVVAFGGSRAPHYRFALVTAGLPQPVYVTSAPGDATTLYVVEQRGTVEIVRGGAVAGMFLDIRDRVLNDGERGLLSIAFDPHYTRNHYVYADYNDLGGTTHVTRFTASGGTADPAKALDVFTAAQPYPNHKGGQLQFDRKGNLYVGMGDGGTNSARDGDAAIGDPENRAQSPASPLGKLWQLRRGTTRWRIVGFGLRNPWRFSFDRKTGDLWIGDVGAASREEVDFRPAAKVDKTVDYGWSRFEGASPYNLKIALRKSVPVVFPVYTYDHGGTRCTVIGGYVYRGAAVAAARGRYFFGDFCDGSLWSFRVGSKGKASVETQLSQTIPNLESFGEDGRGNLYATSLDGGLYRLVP
jgi:glucose/arabinose dehydrogenase